MSLVAGQEFTRQGAGDLFLHHLLARFATDLLAIFFDHSTLGFNAKCTDGVVGWLLLRRHRAAARLGLAVALEDVLLARVELVVVRQRLVGLNVADRADADAQAAVHMPQLQLAVRVARVVDEATLVAEMLAVDIVYTLCI